MERGFNVWKSILAAYTRPRDIVLQLLPDGPMLPTIGKASGRHILQADEDRDFLESISVCQEEKLQNVMNRLPPI